MVTKTPYRLIEDETPLLPHVVAEIVVAEYLFKNKIQVNSEQENKRYDDLIAYLVNRANELYNINAYFKKKIKAPGDKGRDYLYLFMDHWTEAEIKNLKK